MWEYQFGCIMVCMHVRPGLAKASPISQAPKSSLTKDSEDNPRQLPNDVNTRL